jgi:hypothetical protein
VDADRGNVTGLEIYLDADQCRVLDLGLHVIEVSPKPVPKFRAVGLEVPWIKIVIAARNHHSSCQ